MFVPFRGLDAVELPGGSNSVFQWRFRGRRRRPRWRLRKVVAEAPELSRASGPGQGGDIVGEMRQGIMFCLFAFRVGFDLQLKFIVRQVPKFFGRETESTDT